MICDFLICQYKLFTFIYIPPPPLQLPQLSPTKLYLIAQFLPVSYQYLFHTHILLKLFYLHSSKMLLYRSFNLWEKKTL